jgi:ribosome recycling factor
MDALKRSHKNEEITDDDLHRLEDQVQKLTDDAIKTVDKIVADKEDEVING